MADPFPTGSSLDRVLNAAVRPPITPHREPAPSQPPRRPPCSTLWQALGTVIGGAGGLAQSIWQRPQAFGGAAATPTSVGDTIPTFARMGKSVTTSAGLIAAAGVAFAIGDSVAETLTGSRTPANGFVGGFAMGVVAGVKTQRARLVLGYGLGFGIAGAVLHASGGTMSQWSDTFKERKAGFRKALE